MNDKKSISNFQRTGILITLLAASFITSMSTTVTGNMIPNFTNFFGYLLIWRNGSPVGLRCFPG